MATAVEKHISSEIFKLKLTINFTKHIIHVFTVQRFWENIILPMAALRRAVKKHVEQVMMIVFKMMENRRNDGVCDDEKFHPDEYLLLGES